MILPFETLALLLIASSIKYSFLIDIFSVSFIAVALSISFFTIQILDVVN